MTNDTVEAAESAPHKKAAERVFEAAQSLFYEKGIRAVGVDEIVSRAGVTKPSLYRAFASKDALVAACLQAAGDSNRAAVEQAIRAAGTDPRAQLLAVVRYKAAKMADSDFRGCPMANIAAEFAEADHPGRVVAAACKAEIRGRLAEVAAAIPVARPEVLADGLLMLIEGAFSLYCGCGCSELPAILERNAELLIDAHRAAA
ncbi:TetR/AcrR family transcriptional regulator [Sphingomonas flavalba]|uniref:TetR/AcrR family transcriptional regulator n=1 Tax=Sphingomonas flavalba TaxID=2559804 RepID=UPI00109DBF78|nr:TetR/AcrR family transcriptional regulator [Sphingomonas flavalba]